MRVIWYDDDFDHCYYNYRILLFCISKEKDSYRRY
jgi:hypothetical protein